MGEDSSLKEKKAEGRKKERKNEWMESDVETLISNAQQRSQFTICVTILDLKKYFSMLVCVRFTEKMRMTWEKSEKQQQQQQMVITQYRSWLLKTNQQNEIKDKYL